MIHQLEQENEGLKSSKDEYGQRMDVLTNEIESLKKVVSQALPQHFHKKTSSTEIRPMTQNFNNESTLSFAGNNNNHNTQRSLIFNHSKKPSSKRQLSTDPLQQTLSPRSYQEVGISSRDDIKVTDLPNSSRW